MKGRTSRENAMNLDGKAIEAVRREGAGHD